MSVGIPEVLVIVLVAAPPVLLVVALLWGFRRLQVIHEGQEETRARLRAIEEMLAQGKR